MGWVGRGKSHRENMGFPLEIRGNPEKNLGTSHTPKYSDLELIRNSGWGKKAVFGHFVS